MLIFLHKQFSQACDQILRSLQISVDGSANGKFSIKNMRELEYHINTIYGNDESTKISVLNRIKEELNRYFIEYHQSNSSSREYKHKSNLGTQYSSTDQEATFDKDSEVIDISILFFYFA